MKAFVTILSTVLISSTVFAANDQCLRQLDSMLHRTGEAARLNAAAIHHGFNIYTGEIENVDSTPKKAVMAYLEISLKHSETVEKMRTEFIKNCLN